MYFASITPVPTTEWAHNRSSINIFGGIIVKEEMKQCHSFVIIVHFLLYVFLPSFQTHLLFIILGQLTWCELHHTDKNSNLYIFVRLRLPLISHSREFWLMIWDRRTLESYYAYQSALAAWSKLVPGDEVRKCAQGYNPRSLTGERLKVTQLN